MAGSGEQTLQSVPPVELLPVAMTPAPDSLVAEAGQIRIDFTLPVQESSLTEETLQVSVVHANGVSTPSVPGTRTVEFAVRGSSVVFTPASPFVAGDLVTVYVDGLQSFGSQRQAESFVGTFELAEEGAVQPRIASLTPASGLADEETMAVLTGSGFREGTRVFVGGQEALTTVVSQDPQSIILRIPKARLENGVRLVGAAMVEVRDPSTLAARLMGGFVYRDAPKLVSLSPERAPGQGGVLVALQGRGFAPGLRVNFGGTDSFDVRVTSSQSAEAVAPTHTPGLVDVSVSVGADSGTLPASFLYGSGAVARLSTPPVRDVVVDGAIAYVALGATVDVYGADGQLLMANRQTAVGGLLLANLSEPTHVTLIRSISFPGLGGSRRVLKRGNTVFVAAGSGGVRRVDVTRPDEPLERPELSGNASDIALDGSLLFVGGPEGVHVYDVSDEARRPLRVGSRSIPGGVSALALQGTNLLVSSASRSPARLYVLDARTGDLAERGATDLVAPALHITAEGSRAFLSLGRARQVAIYDLTAPASPAPAGTLVVDDPLGGNWVSAEQTRVAAGIAYVAAGGGKVQRFAVPVGAVPTRLGRASVVGDARTLAFMGRHLLVGTLVLDGDGTPVELPVSDPDDADLPLAGALASVELDTLEIRGTQPGEGDTVAPGEVARVLVTALPDVATASEVVLVRGSDGEPVAVSRQVRADEQGGQVVLTPYAPLALDTGYELRVGANLADLRGARLGTAARIRFRTSRDASLERPEVSSVAPAQGLEAGGTIVEVLGTGFLQGCVVRVGGQPAVVQAVAPDGRWVRIEVPPGKAGAAAVEVINPGGLTGLRLGAYRYLVPPVIAKVQPAHAPFGSRAVVTLTGEGLFPGSEVAFGQTPARGVTMDDTGALRVEVPDDVTGSVALTVLTPGVPPRQFSLPEGFTFTLAERARLDDVGGVLVRAGPRLFTAREGWLSTVDLSDARSPLITGTVEGVAAPVDLAVDGDTLYLAGEGEVVRYDLSACTEAPRSPCEPAFIERVALAPSGGVLLSAVAAGGSRAYIAVAGGHELALMAPVGGTYVVVGRTVLGSGVVRDLDVVDDSLLVLVEDGASSRLEVRGTEGSDLPLIGEVRGLTAPVSVMAREGTRVAVAAGRRLSLVDMTDLSAPIVVAAAADPSGTTSSSLSLSGPWLLAVGGTRAAWIDISLGLDEATFAEGVGAGPGSAIVNGVAVVAAGDSLRILRVPYPTVDTLSPSPGGRVPSGASVAVTLPVELPQAMTTSSMVELRDGAALVPGSRLPGTLTFVPSAALDPTRIYSAQVTLAPMADIEGGAVQGTWTYPLRGGGAPVSLRVDAVDPVSGPVAGGVPVTVHGLGFDASTHVQVGGAEAQVIESVLPEQLTVTLPASSLAGPAVVRVKRESDGAEARAVTPFLYVAPLTFASVTPGAVDMAGGWVRISGAGFHRGLEVLFGSTVASTRSWTPDSVEALVPSGPEGHLTLNLRQPGVSPVVVADAVYRGDVRAPLVARVEPLDTVGASSVPLTATFDVRFDEGLSLASASRLRLMRSPTRVAEAGVSTLLPDGRTLRFTPTAPLVSTTFYVLSAEGVTDVAGNIAAPYERVFRTVDTVKPTLRLRRSDGGLVVDHAVFAAGVAWTFRVDGSDDSDGSVTTSLRVDGQPLTALSGGDYRYSWPMDAVNGPSTLVATATDSSGNTSQPLTVVVSIVADSPPTVSIDSPAEDLTAEEGETRNVVVSALDNHDLRVLELHVDGVPVVRHEQDSGTTASVSYPVGLARLTGAATSATRVLTAFATDDEGQVTAATPRTITVTRDVTAPVVALRTPVAGGRVVGGAALVLEATATDANGVVEVEFLVDGAPVGVARRAPWTVTWAAPVVTSAEAHQVVAVARDARANSTEAVASFTVEPSSGRPYVSFAAPSVGAVLSEGRSFDVLVDATAQAGVASVRIRSGADERVLTQSPWRATFKAPVLDGASAPLRLEAQATDRAGAMSPIIQLHVTVMDDGASSVSVSLAQEPAGPALLGGSTLALVGTVEAGATPALSVHVADAELPVRLAANQSSGETILPEGPEGASVVARAAGTALGGARGVAEHGGALSVFAHGQATQVEDSLAAMEPVALVSQGDDVLVLRADGGGGGELELRSRLTGQRRASRSLVGIPVGVSFGGDSAVVALRRGGAGALERFTLPGLVFQTSTELVRSPTAMDGSAAWLAVATDEGVELRTWTGGRLGFVPLGPVSAVSMEGTRLFAVAGTELVLLDVSWPQAPRIAARAGHGATVSAKVAALADGGVCVAGVRVRCFAADVVAGTLTSRGEAVLGASALSAAAFGELLVVGTQTGARLLDARGAPVAAGLYPAVTGVAGLVPGALVGGLVRGVSRQAVVRGAATPRLTLAALPATALRGGRLQLMDAQVSDDLLGLNGYVSEVSVNQVVVDVRDSRPPSYVDLPLTGDTATVEWWVRDLAGKQARVTRQISLSGAATGPALASIQLPLTVAEGAYFSVVAIPEEPARVAQVEVTLEGAQPMLLVAPVLAGELRAPLVGSTTPLTVTLVAIDAEGRRGPAREHTVQVVDGLNGQGPAVVLERVGTGLVYEGSRVTVRASLMPGGTGDSVRFLVDGQDAGAGVGSVVEAALRMPLGVGTRAVVVTAVARDSAGRESAPTVLTLNVVDDLAPPLVAVMVDPSGDIVAAGSELLARAEASDDGTLERVSLEVRLSGVLHATGGPELRFHVPDATPTGALLELRATAKDRANNTTTAVVSRTVVGARLPTEVASVTLDGATRLVRLGEHVHVATSSGLWIGRLMGAASSPGLAPVATVSTPVAPVSLAVLGDHVALALGEAGLWLVDIGVPASPRVVGRLEGQYTGVAASGRFYAARTRTDGQRVVEALDLGDPTMPIRSVLSQGSAELLLGAQADGPIIAVGTSTVRVPLVTPEGQGGVGELSVAPAQVRATQVDGDLVVSATDSAVHAWVRANGTTLSHVSEVGMPSGVRALDVVRGVAYVAGGDGWLRVVDLREPSRPWVVARSALDVSDVLVTEGLLLTAGPTGVRVLKLPDSVPTVVAEPVALPDMVVGLAPFRGGVLAATRLSGVQAIDVAGGAKPQVVGPLFAGQDVRQVERAGRDVLFLDGSTLKVARETAEGALSANDLRADALVALGAVERFAATQGRLWTVSSGTVKSVRWPAAEARDALVLGSAALDVAGDEKRALVALGNQGVGVVEVAPSGQLRRVATLPVAATNVALDGTLAVVGGTTSLAIYRWEDGASPVLIGTVPTAGAVQRIRLEGRLALVSEGTEGVELWHLPEGAAAVRLGKLSATSASDAVLAAGRILVADGAMGVRDFSPPVAVIPSARVYVPGGTVTAEAGTDVVLAAEARGVAVDDAELVVDGVPVVAVDDQAPRARWSVPADSVVGQRHSLRFRVRGAGGVEALSPALFVDVKAPSTGAPVVAVVSPGANQQLRSGAVVTVSARRTGGLSPVSVVARLGSLYLGSLTSESSDPTLFKAWVRAPVVSTSVDLPLTVQLTDGAGRSAEAAVTVRVLADTQAPGVATGLPSELRVSPFVNLLHLVTTDDGQVSLSLERDGVVVASGAEASGSASLDHALVLSEELIGQEVRLTVTAEDAAGRRSVAEQRYVVKPDGSAPTVVLGTGTPPETGHEGATLVVQATAWDADGDLVGVRLYADGVEIGAGTGGQVSASHVLPMQSTKASVQFRAVATDARGRTATAERTTTVNSNVPPVLTFSMTPDPAIQGELVRICARATDTVGVSDLTATVDGVPMLVPTSCGAGCRELCTDATVASTATAVHVAASAEDTMGSVVAGERTFQVNANQPPVISLGAISFLSVGVDADLSGWISDERGPLAWAEFRVNGAVLGSRVASPNVGATLRQRYTPAVTGTAQVCLFAEDRMGLVGQSCQSVAVVEPQQPTEITEVIAANDFRFENQDIVVKGNKVLRIDGAHTFRSLYVLDTATVTHSAHGVSGQNGMDLTVTHEVRVATGARIDVSERGYLGGYREGNAQRAGRTLGNVSSGLENAAGSHGGHGGHGQYGVENMPVYGDYREPAAPGSGGAATNSSSMGGTGGGLLKVKAGSLKLDGQLLADGQLGWHGGAGGGIRVEVGAFTGTGSINANGGNSYIGGGGGGGRVAVYYDTATSSFDWSKVLARGGPNGGVGSVYLKGSLQEYGDLVFDQVQYGFDINYVKSTPVEGGAYDRFAVRRTANIEVQQDLVTPWLQVDGGTLLARGQVSGAIPALAVLNGGHLSLSRPWAFPEGIPVELGSSSQLTVAGGAPLKLSSLKLGSSALVKLSDVTLPQAPALELEVSGAVEVGSAARIDVSERGYLGGYREGNAQRAGRTLGNVSSGLENAAGSHGGHGGHGQYGVENMPVYGDYREPAAPGSGGAATNSSSMGGTGGGLLKVKAGSLKLDGQLLADGQLGWHGGAGGGIRVEVGAFTGTGSINANGGNSYIGGGGGGGRVAVYYDTATSSFDWSKVLARGGPNGGVGSVYLKGSLQEYGDLVFDQVQYGFDINYVKPTTLLSSPGGQQVFRNFTVTRNAQVFTTDTLVITGTLTVSPGARLQSQNYNLP
ncbi:hypothetical protein FJV41_11775 [Myxococcus llanfairpwllgwyngyllgogerychwyrndrobwllllantysiliogogogochensis]|uniref:IPT/TIG domain-containing protein n=1 Tax=Myxococcus llanfairpwllgwyngyllgogerychwyrndrobwllllantysiliogogogochensis TaxID=2590453 RepID=A0A540X3E2_9BACT|nr:hypothetical protein FJV41_11775 [Myxococcus llanfairpwllgwyngyllgogerychwyrndrobwllllantysiliogogogochensis]